MDSGSTLIIIFAGISLLGFLGLYTAEAILPLLRGSQIRDILPERGLREAAVRRLRSERSAYHELVRLLSLISIAIGSSLSLLTFSRVFNFSPGEITFALVVELLTLFALMPVLRALADRMSPSQLIFGAAFIQLLLWPLVPLQRVARSIFVMSINSAETNNGIAVPTGTATPTNEPSVEEQIAQDPLDPRERSMIRAILLLEETIVREVMVPRVDVDAVEIGTNVQIVAQQMLEHAHSRLPVYQDTLDNIVGMVYSRDLLTVLSKKSKSIPKLNDLMRQPFFVPESKRADETLSELQEKRVQIAIVVDEYGGTAGVVTIEDLLEEIVGEIEDEFDVNELKIEHLADGSAQVDARMHVEDFNEAFNADINPEGFDTLGGFLFSKLGRIPSIGNIVTVSGLEIEVTSTTGRRIKSVRVLQSTEEPEEQDSLGKN